MDAELIKSLIEELKKVEKDYKHFFDSLHDNYSDNKLAEIFNELLNLTDDLFIAKIIVYEINKMMHPNNLSALCDFIISKTPEDFKTGDKNVDLTAVKVLCVKTISNYRDKTSVTALLYCLNNKKENYKFRLAAAEALGKIGDSHAVDSLINIVKDEDEKSVYVRESAALALGMIGDKRALEPFLSILEGKKSFMSKFTFLKERIIEALGKLNLSDDKRVEEALLDALSDENAQIRLNALESISNGNYTGMFDEVKKLLFDKNEDVAKGAVVVLYNLSGEEILNEILKDKNMPQHCKQQAGEILEEYVNE